MAKDGNKLTDGLKKFLLVGIGAAAATVEKSQEIIDELAKKGEITMEQSKDLQQSVRTMFEKTGSDAEELAKKLVSLPKEEFDKVKSFVEEYKKETEELKAAEELEQAEDEMYREEGAPVQPLVVEDEPAEEEKKDEEEKAEEETAE